MWMHRRFFVCSTFSKRIIVTRVLIDLFYDVFVIIKTGKSGKRGEGDSNSFFHLNRAERRRRRRRKRRMRKMRIVSALKGNRG